MCHNPIIYLQPRTRSYNLCVGVIGTFGCVTRAHSSSGEIIEIGLTISPPVSSPCPQLNPPGLTTPRRFLDLLFDSSSQTLLEVAADPKRLGAEIGFPLHPAKWAFERIGLKPLTPYATHIGRCLSNAELRIAALQVWCSFVGQRTDITVPVRSGLLLLRT